MEFASIGSAYVSGRATGALGKAPGLALLRRGQVLLSLDRGGQHSEMNSLESLPLRRYGQCRLLEIDASQNQPLVRRSGKIAPGSGTVQQVLRVWHCPETVRDQR